MKKLPLDLYDEIPDEMRAYLKHNGWHFNHKACEYAVRLIKKRNTTTGKMESVEIIGKDKIDELLSKHGVVLENNTAYDYVYVANVAKARFFKSSVVDEQRLAMYIKDVIDDEMAGDGEVMRCWDAEMTSRGIPVEWEEIL